MSIRASKDSNPTVAIIGAGLGGIATAVKLQTAGLTSFTIFERSAGVGGTWWDNRYPGCEVDVPSIAYSYTFMPYPWTRTHARAADLQRYVEEVVDRFGLWGHLRLSTGVKSVVWDDCAGHWLVETTDGERKPYTAVVSAVGMLNNPRYPDWPGLDSFQGPQFHTARWEDHDLTSKTVAVVGTGSTATQVVPALASDVGHLYVFQREPGWVLPKNERDYTPEECRRYRSPLRLKVARLKFFRAMVKLFRSLDPASKEQEDIRAVALRYIDRTVEDPKTRKAVTPDYPFGCKRPVFATTFYPSLNRSNVELIPRAVSRVTPSSVIDSEGVERPVDAIIFATGFRAADYLSTFDVRGRHSLTLKEYWGDRPRAFLGITVPNFPNFFILYGPNTNGGVSIITQLELQAEMAVRSIRRLRRRNVPALDTRPWALDRWVRWIDQQIVRRISVVEAGCNNYYHSPSGANVTQFPYNHFAYWVLTKVLPPFGLTPLHPPGFRTGVAKGNGEGLQTIPSSFGGSGPGPGTASRPGDRCG